MTLVDRKDIRLYQKKLDESNRQSSQRWKIGVSFGIAGFVITMIAFVGQFS